MKILTEGSKELLMARLQCIRDTGFAILDQIEEAKTRKIACCGGPIGFPYFYGKANLPYRPPIVDLVPNYGIEVNAFSDEDIQVIFNSTDDEWIFLAVHESFPVKTYWEGVDPLNHGNMEGPINPGGGLFPYHEVTRVTNAYFLNEPYRIYLSNYRSAAGTLTFKNL